MKSFGFTKSRQKKRYQNINIWFAVFWFFFFLIFSAISTLKNTVLATPTQELFNSDLEQLALYLQPYDTRGASVLLSMQRIVNWYDQGKDYLKTYKGDIENVLQYLSNTPSAFSQLGLQEYKPFLDFLAQASQNKEDIFSLLGAEKEQTYIILLQNAAEKRPNGWFFGSFIKITVFDAHITDMQLIDSYAPGTINPNVTLQAPEWAKNSFLSGDDTITFLASNKFGFTDMDGANIKKLYDKTYNDDIRGVVFVNSNLFAELLGWFQELLREWQFNNATIDLIRWANLPNKKELYFNGVNNFVKTHTVDLIKAITKNFGYIQENRYLQAHIVRTSDDFKTLLTNNSIVTKFDNQHLYLWDYNNNFNKIDTFISKNISIFDAHNKLVYDGKQDVIPITALWSGTYTMHIQYAMNIPEKYMNLMYTYAQEYGISLNVREKHILALFAERSTRGVIYTPQNITIKGIDWPVKSKNFFETPFSNNGFYVLENTKNNSIKEVIVNFEIK